MIRTIAKGVGFMGVGYLLHRRLATDQTIQTVAQRKFELETPKKIRYLDSSRLLTHQELALVTKFSSFKHRAHALDREVETTAAIPDSLKRRAALFALIIEIEHMKQDCQIVTDTFYREAQKRPVIKEACDAGKILDEIEALHRRAIGYL